MGATVATVGRKNTPSSIVALASNPMAVRFVAAAAVLIDALAPRHVLPAPVVRPWPVKYPSIVLLEPVVTSAPAMLPKNEHKEADVAAVPALTPNAELLTPPDKESIAPFPYAVLVKPINPADGPICPVAVLNVVTKFVAVVAATVSRVVGK